jgi:hypothetical protein
MPQGSLQWVAVALRGTLHGKCAESSQNRNDERCPLNESSAPRLGRVLELPGLILMSALAIIAKHNYAMPKMRVGIAFAQSSQLA